MRWLEWVLELPFCIVAGHPFLGFLCVLTAVLASFAVWWATHDVAPGVATGVLVLGVASIGLCFFWAASLFWCMALEELRNRQVPHFVGTMAVAGSVYWGLEILTSYLG